MVRVYRRQFLSANGTSTNEISIEDIEHHVFYRERYHREISNCYLHRTTTYQRLCGAIQSSEMDDGSALLAILDDIFESKLALCDSQCLPVGVCSSCKESVKFVENFWMRCKEAQETLRSIFDEQHNVTDNQQVGTPQTSRDNEAQEYLVSETDILVENQQELDDHEETDIHENSCNDTTQEDLNSEAGDELYGTNLSTIEMLANMPDESKNLRQHRKRNNDVFIESVTILERDPKNYGTLTKKTVPSYICHVCGKTFRSRGNLSNHKQIHSNELRFSCDACGKQFKMRRDLTMHIESIHECKLFKCNLCDVQFRWRKGLQRHVKVVHTRTAFKHDCQVCKKKFTTPGKLREHVMKHTGDRLWCEICGAGYRFNYMLTQHKIRKHSMTFAGVKLYEKKVSNYTKSAQRNPLQTGTKTCNIGEIIMESEEGEEHLLEAVDYDVEILDSCDKTV
ncbi:zinc finger imprinted 3-like [Anopheles cruzii]|uniref:zinc finger imprinted 3-like n=1 Tax=Anopheles cruzii TaxID=68878 RepID=UPI0022EC5010|nr:zinc finger imprinted 3-like [Anopheles cruzii]